MSFDERAPTALVVGSALEFEGKERRLASRDELAEVCARLGQTLALKGFNLVNGACPGLPDDVMCHFIATPNRGLALGLSAYPSPLSHTEHKPFAPDGFPLRADVTVFCGTGFELLNVLNTLCADVLIVVGGGLGALLEAATAVEQELPVLCYSPSGGMANELHSLLGRYVAKFKNYSASSFNSFDELVESLSEFAGRFRQISKPSRLTVLIHEIQARIDIATQAITIEVADDCSWVTFATSDDKLTLHDPKVMTDRVRIARIPNKGDAILHALDVRPRTYRYDGVSLTVSPSQHRTIWAPSIDTLLLLRALRTQGPVAAALEIGTGAGLISLWLAKTGRAAHILGTDVDEVAVLCAMSNAVQLGLDSVCQFRKWTLSDIPNERRFDLLVCNPPYLPHAQEMDRIGTAYGGTTLLRQLLDGVDQLMTPNGIAYIILSSATALDSDVASRLQVLASNGAATLISSIDVPLKVSEVLRDQEWVAFLARGGGIVERADDDYRFWHRLDVWQLSSPTSAAWKTAAKFRS
jgi:methylase of polypeptide subunit release factors/predicted Rossmann-fold nucleotide-binding protein